MADIKVLMVVDGDRFNFGMAQGNVLDANYFGISQLLHSLRTSTTPTIQVDTAHRRGNTYGGSSHDPDCSVGLTYPGNFLFTSIDLNQYDVLWLIGDEGLNGTIAGTLTDSEITDPEKIVIAQFMQDGGGVFAVGDHDGIGALMCGKLPRIRVMRKWWEWDQPQTDPVSGQAFVTNWSVDGSATSPGYPQHTDRFDTLMKDSAYNAFYFDNQADPTPQDLKTQNNMPFPSGGPVHPILRGPGGVTITKFPDHMHEGEATDLASISPTATPFNPNDGGGVPLQLAFQDAQSNTVHFVEFPKVAGDQPTPHADLKPVLRRLLRDQHPDALVLDNRHGLPFCALEGSGGSFSKLLRRTGLARQGLSFYSLRHTFAADLASAGHSLEKIGKLLGHTDPRSTKIYAHLTPEALSGVVHAAQLPADPWVAPVVSLVPVAAATP